MSENSTSTIEQQVMEQLSIQKALQLKYPSLLKSGGYKSRLIQSTLALNLSIATAFMSNHNRMARMKYRVKHPTEIITHECMDGRSALEVITGTMPGILCPFRNAGDVFKLGWPYFGKEILDFANYGTNKGRNIVAICTYHYSEGEHARGCKAFSYNKAESIEAVMKLRAEYLEVFDGGVVPVVWGIETDSDALILHGEDDSIEPYKIEPEVFLFPQEDVIELLRSLYPSASTEVINDLAPLIIGNIEHQWKVIPNGKDNAELDHTEEVIAIGWRLDSLTQRNKVLSVGPFDPEGIEQSIITAAHVVLSSIKEGRIAGDEVLLMASMPYWDAKPGERNVAAKSAKYFAWRALNIIEKYTPELLPYLNVLVLTVNMNTRQADVVDFDREK